MRLAKIQLARSIWLFDTAELNPFGISLFESGVVSNLVQKYRFKQHPNLTDQPLQAKSWRFDTGSFLHEDGKYYDVGLEVFADGITGDCRFSTVICDAFLREVINGIAAELEVTVAPSIGKKRAYKSELIIYADENLSGISPMLDIISDSLGELLGVPTEPTAFSFGSDGRHSLFSIERAVNEPFENLKYFSSAMMQTSDHVTLLNRFTEKTQEMRKSLAERDEE
jgi:hypothetical protein